jgi:hypothetical protein
VIDIILRRVFAVARSCVVDDKGGRSRCAVRSRPAMLSRTGLRTSRAYLPYPCLLASSSRGSLSLSWCDKVTDRGVISAHPHFTLEPGRVRRYWSPSVLTLIIESCMGRNSPARRAFSPHWDPPEHPILCTSTPLRIQPSLYAVSTQRIHAIGPLVPILRGNPLNSAFLVGVREQAAAAQCTSWYSTHHIAFCDAAAPKSCTPSGAIPGGLATCGPSTARYSVAAVDTATVRPTDTCQQLGHPFGWTLTPPTGCQYEISLGTYDPPQRVLKTDRHSCTTMPCTELFQREHPGSTGRRVHLRPPHASTRCGRGLRGLYMRLS